MTYDANGNMTQWGYRDGDGQRYTYTYDAFGRLMKVQTDIGAGAHDHTKYRYNGLGFRIAWQYDTDASQTLTSSEQFYFMYDERWRIVGTFRNTDDYAKESFVYHASGVAGRGSSSYIDSVILRDKDTTNGWTGNPDGSLEERRFYCQNWRADVVAITNSSGLPLEFIRYTSYGKAQVFAAADVNRDGLVNATDADDWDDLYSENPSGAAIPVDFNFDGSSFDPADTDDFNALYSAQSGFSNALQLSSLGNRKGYAGYEFDQAIEAYHVRHRVYLPEVGRWTRRDPIGYVDGMALYEYVRSAAVLNSDSTGRLSNLLMQIGKKDDPCKALEEDLEKKRTAHDEAQRRLEACLRDPPMDGPGNPGDPGFPRPSGCTHLWEKRNETWKAYTEAYDKWRECKDKKPPNVTPTPPTTEPPDSPPTTPPNTTPAPPAGLTCLTDDDGFNDDPFRGTGDPTNYCNLQFQLNVAHCESCCPNLPAPFDAVCLDACITLTDLQHTRCMQRQASD